MIANYEEGPETADLREAREILARIDDMSPSPVPIGQQNVGHPLHYSSPGESRSDITLLR
ncbi:hypothetical protein [Variovorax sp. J31P207]|uniref:hypothetical protein n=1 Tax=Variovorax sp. J31P207 TaxID=3053510 RepID=UPI002578C482|nr:hypothetical protein [Variovorax sp. J31P207]MDM0066595.1 hypothetical protein [Variovorax sp. J31P207]